jgi:hypothetical protein
MHRHQPNYSLDRRSVLGNAREKALLIKRHRILKSASPDGKVHTECIGSGKTTQSSIRKGWRSRTRFTFSRNEPISRISKSLLAYVQGDVMVLVAIRIMHRKISEQLRPNWEDIYRIICKK